MTDQKTPTLPQTDMSAAETARAGGEREAFEVWATREFGQRPLTWLEAEGGPYGMPPGIQDHYYMCSTQTAWEAWQARAALSAPPAPVVAIDAGGQEAKVVPRGVYDPDGGRPGEPYGNADWIAQNHEAVIQFLERSIAAPEAVAPQVCASTCTRAKIDRLHCKCYPCLASHPEAPPASAPPVAAVAQPVADEGTPGLWFVRKRERDGELLDCFVAAPDFFGLPYDAEILGDDEYRDGKNGDQDDGSGMRRKLADCELIVAAVNAYRAALAASPIAPQAGQAGEERAK